LLYSKFIHSFSCSLFLCCKVAGGSNPGRLEIARGHQQSHSSAGSTPRRHQAKLVPGPWMTSGPLSRACGQQAGLHQSFMGHFGHMAGPTFESKKWLYISGFYEFHSCVLCREGSDRALFLKSHLSTCTWESTPSFITHNARFMINGEGQAENRFKTDSSAVFELPFCHCRAIKFTQNCVYFANPCINLLVPFSVTREFRLPFPPPQGTSTFPPTALYFRSLATYTALCFWRDIIPQSLYCWV